MRLIASPAAELMFDVFAPVLGGGSPLQPLPRRQLGQKCAKYCRVIIQKLRGQTLSVKPRYANIILLSSLSGPSSPAEHELKLLPVPVPGYSSKLSTMDHSGHMGHGGMDMPSGPMCKMNVG